MTDDTRAALVMRLKEAEANVVKRHTAAHGLSAIDAETITVLREAADALAPLRDMPPIEVGDWVRQGECLFNVDRPGEATVWNGTHARALPRAVADEIRKADGRIWRRHAD